MRLLLIEDEKALSDAIRKLLEQARYTVDTAYDGEEGLLLALGGSYDAIILDVMLPKMDGFTVLRRLRGKQNATPVLMLTARGGLQDRVQGLEGGAGYYLPKPFEKTELLACLHAITRRKGDAPENGLHFADLTLHPEDASLHCEATGQSVRLGAKEYQLMELLMRHPGQILPKETIAEHVWGLADESEYNNVAVYITFLRRKLTFLGTQAELKATRGLGYSLNQPEKE